MTVGEYKIKQLEQLTGIKAHTIRMWEKRYGIIAPHRSETDIRLYTNDDLTLLLNISILNQKGVKISKIALMNQAQIAEKVFQCSVEIDSSISYQNFLLSLIDLNEILFKKTLFELIKQHGFEKTFSDYLVPFFNRIGVMWLVGTINPAQEHFISHLIRERIIREIDMLSIPEKTIRPVVLFLPEGEWHEIGLLLYQYSLRKRGVFTIYLGQSLPFNSISECICQFNPSYLVTSIFSIFDSKSIVSYFKQLSAVSNGAPIFAGGHQISKYVEELKNNIVYIENTSTLTKINP